MSKSVAELLPDFKTIQVDQITAEDAPRFGDGKEGGGKGFTAELVFEGGVKYRLLCADVEQANSVVEACKTGIQEEQILGWRLADGCQSYARARKLLYVRSYPTPDEEEDNE